MTAERTPATKVKSRIMTSDASKDQYKKVTLAGRAFCNAKTTARADNMIETANDSFMRGEKALY